MPWKFGFPLNKLKKFRKFLCPPTYYTIPPLFSIPPLIKKKIESPPFGQYWESPSPPLKMGGGGGWGLNYGLVLEFYDFVLEMSLKFCWRNVVKAAGLCTYEWLFSGHQKLTHSFPVHPFSTPWSRSKLRLLRSV